MRRRKPPIAIPIIIGLIGLVPLTQNPRFAMYRAVDVLQLIGSGMCFGVALATILMTLRARSRSN